jgi:glycosyltransferase involved in cell wall biosynthesis
VNTPGKRKIGIVTIAPGGGWDTVRKRWEQHFSGLHDDNYEFHFYHIEEYARWIHRRTVAKHRLRSLWYLAAGRAAAKRAVKDGCKTILIDTFHYGVGVPLYKDVRYLVYGDATAKQLTALRPLPSGKWAEKRQLPPSIEFLFKYCYRRLARHGALFLGMSNWYLQGLKSEFGVPDKQLIELPFGLNIQHWKRRNIVSDSSKNGLEVLFIGDPFEDKGGPILQEVAGMDEFSGCTFHFAGRKINFENRGNCRYYRNLKPDSDELLDLFSRCDLMILPTFSDFSPNVAIEALAMSMPVIITDVAAISDIVADGKTGRLLNHPPDKEQVRMKLLEYLNDSELLKNESAAARKRAEDKFDIDKHMRRLYNLLTG